MVPGTGEVLSNGWCYRVRTLLVDKLRVGAHVRSAAQHDDWPMVSVQSVFVELPDRAHEHSTFLCTTTHSRSPLICVDSC